MPHGYAAAPPAQPQNNTLHPNFILPAGVKRGAAVAHLDDDISSSSEDSFDSEFVPPPRKRADGGGLRASVPAPPPPYWDHENHMEACRAELQDLGGAGASWSDIDASEGDSDCDIESDEEESEDESTEEDVMTDPPQL